MDWKHWGFTATLAHCEFSGRRFDYRPGFFVRGFEGLAGGGRVTTRATAGRAGVVAQPAVRSTARGIVIEGFAWGPTPADLKNLVQQFQSLLLDEEQFETLVWTELGETRRTSVQRDGVSTIARRGSTGFADYRLSLSAPDQRIYGDRLETTGWGSSVQVTNRGSYPANILVDVRGSSANGYTISGPGARKAVITAPLVSGTQHTYDADTGLLLVGGGPSPSVARSDRLEIPYGTHIVSVSAGEANVRGRATYNP